MNILVTGGAGFIGSAFVRLCVNYGYNLVILDKLTYAGDIRRIKDVLDKVRFYKVDILNKEFIDYIFAKEKPNIVVHFAAETHVDRSIVDPDSFLKTNILGTKSLLELSMKYGIEKFINISTDEVYGEIKDGKFTEDSPLMPNSPYAVSKASQDMLGRAFYRTYGLPVITIRPSNVYGPWQHPEKLIPHVIYRALKNEKVPVYGKGFNIREWLYVDDCVQGIFKAIEYGKVGEIYNISSGQEKMNIEVVRSILTLLNKDEDLIEFVRDRPGHDYRYSSCSDKAKRDLGWNAETNFEKGLKETVDWYIKNVDFLYEKAEESKDFWEKIYT
ncbi:MAG: dTDP-glucose 4,6-dehydratase [candidate division WOR-3 bacterium]|nr:dTDP-glucose 4,6-dehydratase [candidate division WOR-3 bacterium]